jgi:tetratricopeptide (TPR) repeat protein
MRTLTCISCGTDNHPYLEVLYLNGQPYCNDCIPSIISLGGMRMEERYDPTICYYCQTDYGETELETLNTYPICDPCKLKQHKKNFPLWVNSFLVGLLVLVAFSMYWNWNYYEGYRNYKAGIAFTAQGNYKMGLQKLKLAHALVPESEEVETVLHFNAGLGYLEQEQYDAALSELEECVDLLPANLHLNHYILQAKAGVAYTHKDYAEYLRCSSQLLTLNVNDPNSWMEVASAHACLYATTGSAKNQKEAKSHLDTALAMGQPSKDLVAYANRIRYILATRHIISRTDFIHHYPHGWTKP